MDNQYLVRYVCTSVAVFMDNLSLFSYQSKDDEKHLDDIGVRNGYEAAEEGVAKSNDGGAGNRDDLIQVENHLWKEGAHYTRSKKR